MDNNPASQTVELGLYAHFKGHLYIVTGTNVDCNSQELRVEYYALHDPFRKSSRVASEFLGQVSVVEYQDEHGRLQFRSAKENESEHAILVQRFEKVCCTKEMNLDLGMFLSKMNQKSV